MQQVMLLGRDVNLWRCKASCQPNPNKSLHNHMPSGQQLPRSFPACQAVLADSMPSSRSSAIRSSAPNNSRKTSGCKASFSHTNYAAGSSTQASYDIFNPAAPSELPRTGNRASLFWQNAGDIMSLQTPRPSSSSITGQGAENEAKQAPSGGREQPEKPLTVGASSDPALLAKAVAVMLKKLGFVEVHSISFPNHYIAVKAIALAQDLEKGRTLETCLQQVPLPFGPQQGGKARATKLVFTVRFAPPCDDAESDMGAAGSSPHEELASCPTLVASMVKGSKELAEQMHSALNQQGGVRVEVKGERSVKQAIKSILALQSHGEVLKIHMTNEGITLAAKNNIAGKGPGVCIFVEHDGQRNVIQE